MSLPLLLATGLLCVSPEQPAESPPTPADRAAYEAARDQTSNDAGAQIRLALWCESHGLPAERLKHLALAALRDPDNSAARGLMGIVRHRDAWARPDKVAQQLAADAEYTARMAEYRDRRDKAPRTADAQARLAVWCEQNGLPDEARAHHGVAVQLDPGREDSWRRLGYKKDGRRWVTDAQLAAEKDEAKIQKEADRKWKASLTEWRDGLGVQGDRRLRAEEGLSGLSDPRAVRSVLAVFARGNDADRTRAVRLLGQIDAPASSRALAGFAVFDESAEIRRAATETLKNRDPREFAHLLIALLRVELTYEIRPVAGPGSPGALFVKGQRFDVARLYSPPPIPEELLYLARWAELDDYGMLVSRFRWNWKDIDPEHTESKQYGFQEFMNLDPSTTPNPDAVRRAQMDGRAYASGQRSFGPNNARVRARNPIDYANNILGGRISTTTYAETPMQTTTEIPVGRMIAEYQKSSISAQSQLVSDASAIDGFNQDVRQLNDRVTQILRTTSGEDRGASVEGWKSWYVGVIGYNLIAAPEPYRPTIIQDVPLAYQPQFLPTSISTNFAGPTVTSGPVTHTAGITSKVASCFGAGTMVRTLDGSRAIESLQIGDRVLTEDVADGSLGYHPITKIHHNPPSPTFLVKVGGDTIVSSPFHRFWVAGRGWVMARDLEGGESLRLLGGTQRIDAVEEGPVQPVFNLDVAGDHDFFAGAAAALVHDNSLPDTRLVPFDAPPNLAKASTGPQ